MKLDLIMLGDVVVETRTGGSRIFDNPAKTMKQP